MMDESPVKHKRGRPKKVAIEPKSPPLLEASEKTFEVEAAAALPNLEADEFEVEETTGRCAEGCLALDLSPDEPPTVTFALDVAVSDLDALNADAASRHLTLQENLQAMLDYAIDAEYHQAEQSEEE